MRVALAYGLWQPKIRSAFRWKVPSPIVLIFQIIIGRLVCQLAVHQVLQRAEERRRERGARNNCRVDRPNPMASQRKAGCIYDDVVAAREQIEFIKPRPK